MGRTATWRRGWPSGSNDSSQPQPALRQPGQRRGQPWVRRRRGGCRHHRRRALLSQLVGRRHSDQADRRLCPTCACAARPRSLRRSCLSTPVPAAHMAEDDDDVRSVAAVGRSARRRGHAASCTQRGVGGGWGGEGKGSRGEAEGGGHEAERDGGVERGKVSAPCLVQRIMSGSEGPVGRRVTTRGGVGGILFYVAHPSA